ncbi:MAG: hypothetical protein KGL44_03760 [Sphingomonadales bacterium]|nr:hypothetical protein [Sphingomonadales bacterium]
MTIGITDHALVRWLERTGALDIAALKDSLASSLGHAAAAAEMLQSGHYLILADGLVYVVREGLLVTVLPESGRGSHARALDHQRDGADRDA